MAIFVSASDESAGKDRRDQFVLAGLIASERDWSDLFVPTWERLVLKGPPEICGLHMTEMRSPLWRETNRLSDKDADQRIENAVLALEASDFTYSVGLTVSGADVRDAFVNTEVKSLGKKSSAFEPDYLCFLGYALLALNYVAEAHPECEKLNFMVEQNGRITDYIKDFHSKISVHLAALGHPEWVPLVGELVSVEKSYIPVQAADVLCWHTARARNPSRLDHQDYRRYQMLASKRGDLQHLSRETVQELASLFPR